MEFEARGPRIRDSASHGGSAVRKSKSKAVAKVQDTRASEDSGTTTTATSGPRHDSEALDSVPSMVTLSEAEGPVTPKPRTYGKAAIPSPASDSELQWTSTAGAPFSDDHASSWSLSSPSSPSKEPKPKRKKSVTRKKSLKGVEEALQTVAEPPPFTFSRASTIGPAGGNSSAQASPKRMRRKPSARKLGRLAESSVEGSPHAATERPLGDPATGEKMWPSEEQADAEDCAADKAKQPLYSWSRHPEARGRSEAIGLPRLDQSAVPLLLPRTRLASDGTEGALPLCSFMSEGGDQNGETYLSEDHSRTPRKPGEPRKLIFAKFAEEVFFSGSSEDDHTTLIRTSSKVTEACKLKGQSKDHFDVSGQLKKITDDIVSASQDEVRRKHCAMGCAGCVAVLGGIVLALVVASVLVGNIVGEAVMTYADSPLLGNPTFLPFFYNGVCLHLQASFGDLLDELEAFNALSGYKQVSFPAVGDDLMVSALWLPNISSAPRIVLAHGIENNNLANAVQTTAYFLRSVGFSVLVPNLRGHGGTVAVGSTVDKVKRWQHQSRDVRGALKAVLHDENGVLSVGPAAAGTVGVMGFDFGSLAAQMAFGEEPDVAALLSDGGVHNIRSLFESWVENALGWWPTSLIWSQAFGTCQELSGTDCESVDYTDSLASRGEAAAGAAAAATAGLSAGSVGIIHTVEDTVVPQDQSRRLARTLSGLSGGFTVTEWYPSFRGDAENCKGRREAWLDRPAEYKSFLCNFFANVFDGQGSKRCADLSPPPSH